MQPCMRKRVKIHCDGGKGMSEPDRANNRGLLIENWIWQDGSSNLTGLTGLGFYHNPVARDLRCGLVGKVARLRIPSR